jgi:hypothetical protein
MNTYNGATSNGFSKASWWDVPAVILEFLGTAFSAVSRRIFHGPSENPGIGRLRFSFVSQE